MTERSGTLLAMGITVRLVDPSEDRERILALLERNLPRAAGAERFDWRYLANPDGQALVWLAENEEGEAVATSAAHPRRVRVGKKEVEALNLGDFAVDANYRSLGPALQLLRATLAPVDVGRYAFAYDHGNQAMLAVYKRLGGAGLGDLVRYARPIEVTPVLERRWGKGLRSRVAGALGDLVLRVRDAAQRPPRGLAVDLHEGEFGPEFEVLAERLFGIRTVVGLRTAAYLKWRHAGHPIWPHDVLCARRGGELVGYLVLRTGEPGIMDVVELVAFEPEVVRGVVAGCIALARSRGVQTISAAVLAGCPAASMLMGVGFSERETSDGPVVYTGKDSEFAAPVMDPEKWWMVEGDRDV